MDIEGTLKSIALRDPESMAHRFIARQLKERTIGILPNDLKRLLVFINEMAQRHEDEFSEDPEALTGENAELRERLRDLEKLHLQTVIDAATAHFWSAVRSYFNYTNPRRGLGIRRGFVVVSFDIPPSGAIQRGHKTSFETVLYTAK